LHEEKQMPEFDLVVRGGRVVDGSGRPERTADVAVTDGVVVEIGQVSGVGRHEISADGALVAPGWVDVHTHYDGQATWDERIAPSSWHGVTTAVMGNCGVGFAPVRDEDHDRLIEIMEGVEDIPGTALHEGLPWTWNSFGQYLDALDFPHDIDIATYVPHDPLRLYVMGERGAQREPATADDIRRMGEIARRGIELGAIGFSTDRIEIHRTSRGEHTPAYGAAPEECIGIAAALKDGHGGVLHTVSDFEDLESEFDMLRTMVERSGMALSFTLVDRTDGDQQRLRRLLARIEEAHADGVPVFGQVAPRAIGFLFGLQCTLHPFVNNPVFKEISGLLPAEQAARMRDGEFRARLLSAASDEHTDHRVGAHRLSSWQQMYELADPPNYAPDLSLNFAAVAARRGCSPEEVAYDVLVKDGGQGMIYVPSVNYRDGKLDAVREMLVHPFTLPGLSDGGAHVGTICDASFPTTLLQYWGRDRGEDRLDVPAIVKRQCRDTAAFVGLADRGLLAPGYRADLNVIDFEALSARRPEVHYDLPAGGRRLLQRADGYLHTIVAGRSVYESGEPTGELPGRLVRGRQAGPATAMTT
jgi:N-acyl-D-aspartate/D-glutamate deacylase